jgi:hypothetical protein
MPPLSFSAETEQRLKSRVPPVSDSYSARVETTVIERKGSGSIRDTYWIDTGVTVNQIRTERSNSLARRVECVLLAF